MRNQLPPGQFETEAWPMLHQGDDALFVYRWKDRQHDWQELSYSMTANPFKEERYR